jgi:hypothetical protein
MIQVVSYNPENCAENKNWPMKIDKITTKINSIIQLFINIMIQYSLACSSPRHDVQHQQQHAL